MIISIEISDSLWETELVHLWFSFLICFSLFMTLGILGRDRGSGSWKVGDTICLFA